MTSCFHEVLLAAILNRGGGRLIQNMLDYYVLYNIQLVTCNDT